MAKDDIIYFPKGIAHYPRLVRPDTKFKEDGEYKADVLIPEADALPLMQKLNVIYKNHTGKAHPKKPKLKENGQPSLDGAMWFYPLDDQGVETGEVMFRCRVANRRKKDGELWDRRPAQVDGKRKPISRPIPLGGGSVIQAYNAQVEGAFQNLQQQRANLEEGYVSELAGRSAIAQARVRGSSLGIRGSTAGELIANRQRIAAHNAETVTDRAENIAGAFELGKRVTTSNASRQIAALRKSRPGLPDLLLATASGGLKGYVSGADFARSAGIK